MFSAFSLLDLSIQILGRDSPVDFPVNKASKVLCPYSLLLPLGCADAAVCGSQPFKLDNEIVDQVGKKKHEGVEELVKLGLLQRKA